LRDHSLTGHMLKVTDFALLAEGLDGEGGNYCSVQENFERRMSGG
jgi:hypothetical protein